MNKIYHTLIYLIVFFGLNPALQAQTVRGKGLRFNATQYKENAKIRGPKERGNQGHLMPTHFSLRRFCPTPQDQGTESSCSVWASAYGALTIQQAIHRRVEVQKDIDKIAFSKSFVFNQLTENGKNSMLSIEAIFDFLKTKGTCLAATFRNDEPVSQKPDELAILEAQNYDLAETIEVFEPDLKLPLGKQIGLFKRLLSEKFPIVVGLRVPHSFSNLTKKQFSYDPQDLMDTAAHAMCLVGYDDIDSTFELMNSWGKGWGDNGFVRIAYRDMIKLMCCAYKLVPHFVIETKKPAFNGEVILRRSLKYHEDIPQYEEVRVQYHPQNKDYQTIQPDWDTKSNFQLVLRQIPANWWVTVFNIDTKGNLSIFYNKKIETNLIEAVIPNDTMKISFEEKGIEWLGILCTKDSMPISEASLQKNVPSNLNDIQESLRLFFKEQLDESPLMTPKRMGFEFPKKSEPKGVLMILKMQIRE